VSGRLILLCGLAGAGKTTLAKRLEAAGAVRMCPDEWLLALGFDIYDADARVAVEALQWELTQALVLRGQTVVDECGVWQRWERDLRRGWAREQGVPVELRFLDAPVEVLADRVAERNRTLPDGEPRIDPALVALWNARIERPDADELALFDPPTRTLPAMPDVDRDERAEWVRHVIERLHTDYAPLDEGAPAGYIPELASVDPDRFAISAATVDGRQVGVGDRDLPFTIQSISKLLLYGLALETHGADAVRRRVGVAPTGEGFNAIALDEAGNRAPNPMVNAGAIAVTDMVVGADLDERVETVRSLYERYLGRQPELDRAVWASERATGHRNRAIAYLMLSRGIVEDRVEETLDLYFAQCSVLVTCDDLALIGATLAGHGRHPLTGEQVVASDVVRDMLSVALTCGMYDYAGEWVFTVGIPAKSGVGGGILGILPDVGGLATFSPRLDEYGNSVRGVRVFEELSERFTLHLFDPESPWQHQRADNG
jgi:glutaminase